MPPDPHPARRAALKAALLKTLAISLPITLALHYYSWALWLLGGYPIGYVPHITELTPSLLAIWQIIDVVRWFQYLLYGVLFALFARNRGLSSASQIMFSGAIVGSVPALITRVALAVEHPPTFQAQLEEWLGLLVGTLVVIVIAAFQGSVASLATHRLNRQ